MENNLTIQEQNRARKLKSGFSEIHSQIQGVHIEMEFLNKRAKELIDELEFLRKEEMELVQDLESKYGPGKLNPFTLIYETKQETNEKI
jgi:hypothetical protein